MCRDIEPDIDVIDNMLRDANVDIKRVDTLHERSIQVTPHSTYFLFRTDGSLVSVETNSHV